MSCKGIFPDVVGLTYRCGTVESTTATDFAFYYEPNATISFSIGGFVLAELSGKPIITTSDLAPTTTPVSDSRVINRARLLYSLTPGQGLEHPIVIDAKARDAVAKYYSKINLDIQDETELDHVLAQICGELGLLPKSISHARNHVRRAAAGFRVLRDMRLPMRDGQHILGDIYLPTAAPDERYTVLLSCTVYGKRIVASGPDLDDEDEIAKFEKFEDDWHSTTTDVKLSLPNLGHGSPSWTHQRGLENIATSNTFSYVPHGYAMVKIDPRGVSQTPGMRGIPVQLSADIFDAVEWAADQPWSTGDVALVGRSGGANVQWVPAQMKPKGLRCFVPYACDMDMYRDAAFSGGIPAQLFVDDWTDRVRKVSPKGQEKADLAKLMDTNPFDNEMWQGLSVRPSPDVAPCFLAASQIFIIHGRGAFEAWRILDRKTTYLQLVDYDYYAWPNHQVSGKILQFLDHYLKGASCDNLEKVGIQMRLGHRRWYWRREDDWPVPGTQYWRWHLRHDGTLSEDRESAPEKRLTYGTRPVLNVASGVSFLSPPFESDVKFAGHFTARLTISSTLPDADVVVTLWAVDERGLVVPFGYHGQQEPLAKGLLRASHRKLDLSKTVPERAWHTHKKENHMPLEVDRAVEPDIEIFPTAGRLQEAGVFGWMLRLPKNNLAYQGTARQK